jgi:hypothetical protein
VVDLDAGLARAEEYESEARRLEGSGDPVIALIYDSLAEALRGKIDEVLEAQWIASP